MLTGSPIRKELLQGNKLAGLNLCHFNTEKPVILVVGGSTGAVKVNNAVRAILPELLKDFQVVHLCGKGKTDKPNLLIPLSANASRGDQILNANSFKKHGYSAVLMEEDITPETLLAAVRDLYQKRMTYVNNMALSEQNDAIGKIMELITANSK